MGICYIIGAGDFGSGTVAASEGDYIIAGDGGYRLCKERGIQPDLVVGDFDSLGYRPDHPNVRSFPPGEGFYRYAHRGKRGHGARV